MSRCISQTGRMRSGKEEEVGMGRKPGCRDSQTRKASSVKAKHKNRMIFYYLFFFPFQQADELFALSLKKLRCVLCLWRYQPFKRGKQLRHGMLAMVTGVEVVDVTHTHTVYTHTRKAQQHIGAMALSWCKGRWGRLSVSTETNGDFKDRLSNKTTCVLPHFIVFFAMGKVNIVSCSNTKTPHTKLWETLFPLNSVMTRFIKPTQHAQD